MNQTFTYRARPKGLPGPAYCDTSFVVDLFAYAHPKVIGGASVATRGRIKDAHAFYIWARGESLDFYVSILVIEEAYQLLLFSPIRTAAKAATLNSWKDLRAKRPSEFAKALADGRQAVAVFHNFMKGSGLQVLAFGDGPLVGRLLREPRTCRYARALLTGYEADVMDAFHFAVMRRAGLELAIASDSDWSNFPFGTLVTRA